MKPLLVGFQGEPGAFSQVAIRQLLGNEARIAPHQTFEEVFRALSDGSTAAAVIPIENTLHGSVHENYDHLLHYDGLTIVGETSVRVIHNLIAPPGTRLRDVRKVYSHPVALNQCLRFFSEHASMERVPFYDTAGSVKMIMQEKQDGAAAIASEMAAAIYGGEILKRSIEDDRQNFTRFFLLNRRGLVQPRKRVPGAWKTSLVFTVRNVPGALFRSLSAFSLRDINLAKIESRPLRGKPWEYLFYLDFEGREDDPVIEKALGHLTELADFLRILGTYPAAAFPDAGPAGRQTKAQKKAPAE